MKFATLQQVDTQVVDTVVLVPANYEQDENGETITVTPEHTETVRKEVPVMGMVYRDATPEEEADAARMAAEQEAEEANREPTAEERIQQLEGQNAMLLECLLEMSEIVYA